MKYSKWIGITACLLLIIACFLPWAWYPDLNKQFTGFFSEENRYGRPGKVILFFSVISTCLFLIPRIWAQRINVLFCVLNLGFAIRCFIVFGACYMGICPERKPALFLVLIAPFLSTLASVLPDMELKKDVSSLDQPGDRKGASGR